MKRIVIALLVLVPFSSAAEVWCKNKSGVVTVREACRKNETQLDLSKMGLQGPAGPQGPAGKDAIIAQGCPSTLDGVYSGKSSNVVYNHLEGPEGEQDFQTSRTKLIVISINGNSAQVKFTADVFAGAEMGGIEGGVTSGVVTLPLSFDRQTCSGTLGDPKNEGFFIVVSAGGAIIDGISYKKESSKLAEGVSWVSGSAPQFTLTRQ